MALYRGCKWEMADSILMITGALVTDRPRKEAEGPYRKNMEGLSALG